MYGWLLQSHKFMSNDLSLFHNRSFLFGDALFETILIFRGIAYWLPEHSARLQAGMAALGLAGNATFFLEQAVAQLPPQATGRLRVQVWRAGAGAYVSAENTALWAHAFTPLERSVAYPEQAGARCILSPDIRTLYSPISGFKTASALPYVLAARQAQAATADEAILRSHDGFLAEASACNLFWIKGGQLFTPPLQTGCVSGVMRQVMFRLWLQMTGKPVQEMLMLPEELPQQEAVFLTNAIRGIWPVAQIENIQYNTDINILTEIKFKM